MGWNNYVCQLFRAKVLIQFFHIFFCYISLASAKDPLFQIVFTSDLHSWLSTSSTHHAQHPTGLFFLSEQILNWKKKQTTLLLDAGDLVQGAPISFYYTHVIKQPEQNPFWRMFNKLGYDAVAIGNHDLDTNPFFEDFYLRKASFPWLSANVVRNHKTIAKPFIVKKIKQQNIAIMGLTTPGVHLWTGEEKLKGIKVEDQLDAVRKWYPIVKKQNPDFIIGLFHIGVNPWRDFYNAKAKGTPIASDLKNITEEFNFDLILSGHDHLISPNKKGNIKFINKTPVISGGSWGRVVQFIKVFDKKEIVSTPYFTEGSKTADYPFPKEFQDFLNEESGWKIRRNSSQKPLERCFNTMNALAYKTNEADGSLFPKLFIKKNFTYTTKIMRKLIYKLFPYENRPVLVNLNLRDIELLSSPSKSYNRNLFLSWFSHVSNIETSRLKINPVKFDQNWQFLVADYHFNGGGGIFSELASSLKKMKTYPDTIRDQLFLFLKKSKSLPQECKNVFSR